MSKANEIIRDTLYEMKVELGIDTDDIIVNSRLCTWLNDIYEEGVEYGKSLGHTQGWQDALSRFDNKEVG